MDNLIIGSKKKKYENFFLNESFIGTSKYIKTKKILKIKNKSFNELKNISNYNTLIIDGEGVEEYFIKNISKIKNIKYLIFELHNNIFNQKKIANLFSILRKNNFNEIDKCFNSYYFKK